MNNTLKIDFDLYESNLPVIRSSKIFANNKNEYDENSLYSQRIFGPVNDYECKCGKLKGKFYKGHRCDDCGVLCDSNDLRMKTFAKIELPKDVWVIFPPLKHMLYKIFGKKQVDKILSFDPHVYEKDDFYLFDLNNLSLVNIHNIIDDKKLNKIIEEEGIDLTSDEIDSEKLESVKIKFIEKYMDQLIDKDKYLDQFRIYSVINLKELFDYIYDKMPEIFEVKGFNNINIVKHIFINDIPVTPPDTRPVIKIAKNRFSVNDITKSYSEILKNLEHKFMDDIYLQIQDKTERDIYLANASKKFQRSVDDIYKFAQDKQFGDKASLFRNSILGKTVEFSGRTVVSCGPNVPPYMISMPRESAKIVFILEVLNYLVNNENDILDINDIASLMQLIVNNIDDAELKISDEQFDEIFEKIRPSLRAMFERPPTLFMYNDSTFILDELFESKFQLDGSEKQED